MVKGSWPYILFSLTGIALFLLMTASHGLGLTTDSADYFYGAMSLANKGVLTRAGEQPFVQWPPLYPMLLACLDYFNALNPEGIRYLHAFLYGAALYVTGKIIEQYITTTWLKWWTMLTVLLMTPLMLCFLFLWSEAFFIFFSVLFLAFTARYSKAPTIINYTGILVTLILCILQRYNGIFYCPVAAFFIFYYSPPGKIRNRTVLSCLLPVLITGLWLLRNYINYDTLTGEKQFRTLHWQGITDIADIITAWVLPNEMPLVIRALILLILISMGGYLFKANKVKFGEFGLQAALLFIVFISGTTGVLLIYRLGGSYMDPRFFSPALIPGTLVIAYIINQSLPYFSHKHKKFITILLFIWLLYPALRTFKQVTRWQDKGIGYASEKWLKNDLVNWYKQYTSSDSPVYSNRLPPLIFGTNKPFHYYQQLRRGNDIKEEPKPGSIYLKFGNRSHKPCFCKKIYESSSGSIWKAIEK